MPDGYPLRAPVMPAQAADRLEGGFGPGLAGYGHGMVALNVAQKLIRAHLVQGEPTAGQEIGLRVDQTLTQDATGTMVMLELEALDLDRVRTESVQYVDHNLLQTDERNMADHLFLRSACRRFGLWAWSTSGSRS
jgi:homoaconitase/3-isopropylmalate dehydratase large subunit